MSASEFNLQLEQHKARLDALQFEMDRMRTELDNQKTLVELFGVDAVLEADSGAISEDELNELFAECSQNY